MANPTNGTLHPEATTAVAPSDILSNADEHQLFSDVINKSPLGLYVWHLEDLNDPRTLRMVTANAASQSATGVAPENIIGKTMPEAFAGLMQTQIPEIYANVVRTGKPVDLGEVRYGDENVRESIFYVRAFPLSGNNVGISFENITERKLQEESLERALKETEALYRGTERVNKANSVKEIFQALVESTALQSLSAATLMFFNRPWEDETPETLLIDSTWTADDGGTMAPAGTIYPTAFFPLMQVFRRNEPSIITDITSDERLDTNAKALIERSGIKSLYIFPLIINNQWIGMVSGQARALTTMTENEVRQISTLVNQAANVIRSLRLYEQTQKRATELETVSKVSAAAASVLDVNELLQLVSDLTKENFHLYHAHIYLLDEATKSLKLVAGAGEAGRQMRERGHQIPLDKEHSLVANAARTHKGVIANDVTTAPDFLPNPILPDTKSEMAIPLIVGDTLLGVLDLQADVVNRFTEEDVRITTTLAGQIAVAIKNSRAFQEAQTTRLEAEQNERLMRTLINATKDWIFVKDRNFRLIIANESFASAFNLTPDEMIGKNDYDLGFTDELVLGNPAKGIRGFRTDDTAVLGGETIHNPYDVVKSSDGTMMIFDTQKMPLRDPEGNVFAALGFAHDITETRQQAEAIRRQAEESARISQLLRTLIDNLPDFIYVKDVESKFIIANAATARHLGTPTPDDVVGKSDFDFHPSHLAERYRADEQSIMRSRVPVYHEEPSINHDTGEKAWLLTNKIPLQNEQGEVIGLVGINRDITDRKQQEEVIRKSAAELEVVARVSAATATILDVDLLLQTVADLTKENFNLYHAHVYLLDPSGENLVLAAGAGDIGRTMKTFSHRIPLNKVHSLVARAARYRQGIVTNDVSLEPDFLPNPLLPDTRSELAVPMIVGNKLIGVLDVQAITVNRFSEQDVRIKTTLAEQIAIAVQNARQFSQAQRHLEEAVANAKIVEYIRAGGELEDMLENVLHVIRELMKADSIVMSNFDYEFENWQGFVGVGEGISRELVKTFVDQAERYPHGVAALRGKQVVPVDNARLYPDFPMDYVDILGIKSVLVLPVILSDHATGVIFLNYNSQLHSFSDEELVLARTLADQISVAIERKQTEDELARINFAVESSSDAITITDINSKIQYANRAYNELFGFTIDELKTISPMERFVEADRLMEMSDALIASGNWSGELTVYTKNGGTIPSSTRVSMIYDSAHKPLGYVSSITDITERKRAEEEISRRATEMETVTRVSAAATTLLNVDELLHAVVELTKESFNLYHTHIYLLDEERKHLVLAAGAGEAGALMKEIGHYIPLNLPNSVVATTARTRKGVILNDVTTTANYLPNPLLPETLSEMAVPMIIGDELIGILDIQSQQRNRFSDEDVKIQSTLADQIAVAVRNARAFEVEHESVERLREVDRLKSQFLANMSHELRTPLNSIIGYSEVLLDGVDGELPEEAIEDIQAVHSSGRHLLAIINEILDMAKIDAGQLHLDRQLVDIATLMNDVAKAGHILVKEKELDLKVVQESTVPSIYVDPLRVRQIMLNLIGNAIKFTERGSVTILFGRVNDSEIQIKVRDTGVGISAEHVGLVFERFRQVDGSSTRRAGGTGLGLSITQQLVNMHGGDIGVESEFGVGSTFWFTLPIGALPKTRTLSLQP